MSSALAGAFLTTGPPGKSLQELLWLCSAFAAGEGEKKKNDEKDDEKGSENSGRREQ